MSLSYFNTLFINEIPKRKSLRVSEGFFVRIRPVRRKNTA